MRQVGFMADEKAFEGVNGSKIIFQIPEVNSSEQEADQKWKQLHNNIADIIFKSRVEKQEEEA
jgi:hypothetical protein